MKLQFLDASTVHETRTKARIPESRVAAASRGCIVLCQGRRGRRLSCGLAPRVRRQEDFALGLRRQLDHRPRRAWRRSASAPVCTSVRPVSADCTTSCTRSWTTPSTRRWPDHADTIEVTMLADGGVRVIDNGRGIPVGIVTRRRSAGRRGRADRRCTRAASSTASATRSPAVCTASASPSSTRCRPGSTSRSARDGYLLDAGLRRWRGPPRRWSRARRPTRPAPRSPSGPTRDIFETTDVLLRDALRRFQEMAFLNKGLTITAHGRAARLTWTRTASRTSVRIVLLRGRHRRLRQLPQRRKRSRSHPSVIDFERGRRRASRSRSRCSGTAPTPSRCYTFANTINTR